MRHGSGDSSRPVIILGRCGVVSDEGRESSDVRSITRGGGRSNVFGMIGGVA